MRLFCVKEYHGSVLHSSRRRTLYRQYRALLGTLSCGCLDARVTIGHLPIREMLPDQPLLHKTAILDMSTSGTPSEASGLSRFKASVTLRINMVQTPYRKFAHLPNGTVGRILALWPSFELTYGVADMSVVLYRQILIASPSSIAEYVSNIYKIGLHG